jgi:RNA polymerase sigma-70 factor (ECF subfamily)
VEHQSEDLACVRRALSGEHHGYEEIVSRYQKRVFSLLLMMVRDHSAAEEVTQDTFMRAYSNLHKYDLQRPFYPWLATIARRLGINWINRSGAHQPGARQRSEETEFDVSELPASTPQPTDQLAQRQVQQQLWDQVASLPQGERTAVLLFYKQELRVTDIAGILGVTTGTVKTFLHRGRAHLKTQLESNGDMK